MKTIASLLLAFSTLTALPIPFPRRLPFSTKILARSAAFFPLVGFCIGGVIYAVCRIGMWCALPTEVIAFAVLIVPYVITKFFHLDGLSDVLDGFLANRAPPERLRIMKDSRVGSFAVGGIVLIMLAKFIVLDHWLSDRAIIGFVVLVPVFSRLGAVILAAVSRYPRSSGTGKPFIGALPVSIVLIAVLMAFAAAAPFAMVSIAAVLVLAAAVLVLVIIMRAWSYVKIGGVTGDVLGAYIELTELVLPAVLLVCARCAAV